ncbi:DUF7342 family protein [Halobellus ordinarius]|uniref:DUF7342 family protein n=1 Tax=Halobellus ordinarius TaxID=3075120 RepID=UPI0028808309|nr:hypothetical protein [Halobellus sp. ZY16]
MSDKAPPDLTLTDEWDTVRDDRTVKDRVYEIATTLTSPTPVVDIADRADCTKEGARPHLEWFVELGVLEKVADNPALFVRNEAYFAFRRVTELTRKFETAEAIDEAIDAYRDRERDLAAQFDAPSPETVVLSDIDADNIDDVYDTLSTWRAVTRRLRELHEAKLRLESESSPASASPLP